MGKFEANLVSASVAFVVTASGPAALAGPWAQDQGVWQDTTSVSYETGDFGLSSRQDYYLEAGLHPKWTGVFKIESLLRTESGQDDRTAAQLGVRRQLWRNDIAAISIQGAVLFGESFLGDACSGTGFETRTGAGRNINAFGQKGFAALEGAYRAYGGGCSREKLDAVVGLDLAPKWRIYGKLFGETGGGVNSVKAELQVTRRFWGHDWGLGYRQEFAGEFEERAILVSMQRSF